MQNCIGFLSLFITFTGNPQWIEIQMELKSTCLRAEDRHDLICRLFNMKLDLMLKDFKKGDIFGKIRARKNHYSYFSYTHINFCLHTLKLFVKNFFINSIICITLQPKSNIFKFIVTTFHADVCTIEFKKCGLPHAHILLRLKSEISLNLISTLIDSYVQKYLARHVIEKCLYMMHGPCGEQNMKSPRMHDSKCSKRFPKRFVATTMSDEDGYPLYI